MFQVEQRLGYVCAECLELVTVEPRGQLLEISAQQCSLGLGFGGVILITALALPGFLVCPVLNLLVRLSSNSFEPLDILSINAFSG